MKTQVRAPVQVDKEDILIARFRTKNTIMMMMTNLVAWETPSS
jgi:hypothetical protein